MGPYWSSKEDRLLINFVREHEALFNTKNKDYRKTHLKQQLWAEIGIILNKTDSDCSSRWGYVRDYYIRRKGKRCWSGESARKRAELLTFLDNASSSLVLSNTIEDDNSNAIETVEINTDNDFTKTGAEASCHCDTNDSSLDIKSDNEDSYTDCTRRDVPPIQERLGLFRQTSELKSVQNGCIESFVSNELDETDLFFRSMAKIVKKLPRYEQIQLRMKIGTLVGNAELRNLTDDHVQGRELTSDSGNTSFHGVLVNSPKASSRKNDNSDILVSSPRRIKIE